MEALIAEYQKLTADIAKLDAAIVNRPSRHNVF